MRLHLHRRTRGTQFASYWQLTDVKGEVVRESKDEGLGGIAGAKSLESWAAEQGHEIVPDAPKRGS